MKLAEILHLFTFLYIHVCTNVSPFTDLLHHKEHKHEATAVSLSVNF